MTTSVAKPFYKKWRFIVLMVIVGLIILGSLVGNKGDKLSNQTAGNNNQIEKVSKPKGAIDMEHFKLVEIGLTKSKVDEIFGSEGEMSSEYKISDNKYSTYIYKRASFEMATVTYKDNIVESKMQTGL